MENEYIFFMILLLLLVITIKKYDMVYTITINTVETLINKGYMHFYIGGALGFDLLAANVVINLKCKYPLIKLILVLPFKEPWKVEKSWTANDIIDYNDILKKAVSSILQG